MASRRCEYGTPVKGQPCFEWCKWLIGVPHNNDPVCACHKHLSALILREYERYEPTTTSVRLIVTRW